MQRDELGSETMPRTIEKTVFRFDELSDRAKEKAREWWREAEAIGYDPESIYEDAAECGAILGIDMRKRRVQLMGGGTRYAPAIYYSGFSSQGDGACYESTYSYAKGAAKKIRAHAPTDSELHRIADELQALQRRNFYQLTAETRHRGHYYHSGCMAVDVGHCDGDSVPAEAEEELTQLLRDLADWIYKQLESEYEWRLSDENVDESIRINEYEFDEEGRLAS
jgi:hypothetical protein